jgi:hypothetical protein
MSFPSRLTVDARLGNVCRLASMPNEVDLRLLCTLALDTIESRLSRAFFVCNRCLSTDTRRDTCLVPLVGKAPPSTMIDEHQHLTIDDRRQTTNNRRISSLSSRVRRRTRRQIGV